MVHNRGATLVPTAEPDNNAFGYYPTAGGGTVVMVPMKLVTH